jgi:hypothetical protein
MGSPHATAQARHLLAEVERAGYGNAPAVGDFRELLRERG